MSSAFSKALSFLLVGAALTTAWVAWLNVATVTARLPVSTPVPEWREIERIATWLPAAESLGPHGIVIFADAACGDCSKSLLATDSLRRRHGDFHLGFVYYPHYRPVADGAFHAMVVAECVKRQGKLLDYLRGLFSTNTPPRFVANAAHNLRLDERELNSCLKETRVKDLIDRHLLAARQLGFSGNSAILLDGVLIQPPFSRERVDSAWSSASKESKEGGQ